jgi:predicted metal-dependent hydrolase
MDFRTSSGLAVPVEIQRRKSSRHLRIRIGKQNQVLASVPWRTSDQTLMQFLEKQRLWLEQQLERVPPNRTLLQWFELHPHLTGSGERFQLKIETGSGGKTDYRFDLDGSVLILRLPVVDEPSLLQLVRRFAKDALACRVAFYAKDLNLSYGSLTVRDQSSRWGSCSMRRGISLNWRLVLLDPELQDYVILHELAHLTEMNHGPRFWALLEQYDPLRVLHESSLDELGAEIMRVGRQCS